MIVNYLIKMLGSISLALLLPAMSVQAADNANAQTTAAKEQQLRDKALRAKFPVQYESWQETSEQTEREDMLASYPAAIILWAGSSFAKEYNSPRGHHFAVADVTHTLRTGIPPEPGSKGLSASCWTC
ncbi:ammonia-forming cytochrome c nitrite reductase subunit c552, partial [Shewanella sp. 0m-11]